MLCTICRHPQQQGIALSLMRDGTRDTARRFRVSRSALDRHKKHLPGTLVKAHEAQELSKSASVLFQVKKLITEHRKTAARAKKDRQWAQATGALREVRSCLELLAKGELQQASDRPVVGSSRPRSTEETRADLIALTKRIRHRITLNQSVALGGAPTRADKFAQTNADGGKSIVLTDNSICW